MCAGKTFFLLSTQIAFCLTLQKSLLCHPDCNHEGTAEGMENMADAVTHARFVGTDPASDEVVLMKILQVLATPSLPTSLVTGGRGLLHWGWGQGRVAAFLFHGAFSSQLIFKHVACPPGQMQGFYLQCQKQRSFAGS